MVATLFTNRIGGISRSVYASNNLAHHVGDDLDSVTENRLRLSMLVGPSEFMNQTHGNTVAVVDGISSHEPNADALVTAESGIALGVLVADCIPLLLWDETEGIVAAVHVGRRGLTNGVAIKTLNVMKSLGAVQIQGTLGPSICGKCYEVGKDIYEEVCTTHPDAGSITAKNTLSLDLPKALSRELFEAGVKISCSPICTLENPDFFSYRRDGVTGRQAGLIWQ